MSVKVQGGGVLVHIVHMIPHFGDEWGGGGEKMAKARFTYIPTKNV